MMKGDRRYREDEVREIFGLVTRAGRSEPAALPLAEGLTLGDMLEIGLDAGLDPASIELAAATIDERRLKVPRGTPVDDSTEICGLLAPPGTLTDDEWEQLVS